MLVGTSIGAVNAALLSIYGLTLEGVEKLSSAWVEMKDLNPMTSNYLWLGMKALLGYPDETSQTQLKKYLTMHGMAETTTFNEIKGVELYLVAADLKRGAAMIYGNDPGAYVLEGVLVSAALPPWSRPLNINGHVLVDGGVVSNLPIEPALAQNATRIYALDLYDPGMSDTEITSYKQMINQVVQTYLNRQRELELKLAEARGIPVHEILLIDPTIPPFWDFNQTEKLIERGYEITKAELVKIHQRREESKWVNQFLNWFKKPD
jgi:predicted acylesterase/phospholipase RssA